MIKTRIIPTLLYKDFTLVKGVRFDSWRRVGSLMQAAKVYNMRNVDELVFLDAGATIGNRPPDFDLIDDFADECFMPLAVGGGVKTVDDVCRLLKRGADKVIINSASVLRPEIIKESSEVFGAQSIVVSIDAKKYIDGSYDVHTHAGTVNTGLDPVVLAKQAQDLGAGEILLTSIDRDGTMEGYDIDLVRRVTDNVSIPVIASGGAGNSQDVLEVLQKGKAHAAAMVSIFQFTQSTPIMVKLFLKEHGINVRI